MTPPSNPYIAGAPLRGDKGFFGRQDTLEWVQRELRNLQTNALVLFGQRRIGKTTLLLQLARNLPESEFLPTYFDLQDQAARPLGQTLADLADNLCEKTGLSSCQPANFDDQGRYFQKEFLPQVYAAIGEGRRPVFLLDEFDVLDQTAEAALGENATAKALFPLLRRLMTTDARPAFVFVVGRRAEDLSIDFSATFKASLVREVWVLDDPSAEILVRQAQANGTLSFTGDAVGRILALTSRHPYLTQLLCQRIWELAYASGPTSPPRIDIPAVESALESALEAGNQALEWLWSGLNPGEKIYASALAEIAGEDEPIPEDRIIQVLAEHAARLRTREIELAPRDLVKRHVLEASGERSYRFDVELFRRWVQKNKPLLAVKDEIDRVDPMADQFFVFGDRFYDARNWERAAYYFREALNVNSRHFRARLYLGETLLEQGQVDQAIAELEHALLQDREEARLPLARALLAQTASLRQSGDTDSVLKIYERVLELSPREGTALLGRAAIWKQRAQQAEGKGDLIAARDAYRQAGDEGEVGRLEALLRQRGLAELEVEARQHAAAGRWEAAEAAYARLVSEAFDEDSRLSWQAELEKARAEAAEQMKVLAQAYIERDEWDKAFQIYESLIERQGTDAWQPTLERARLERQLAEMFDRGRQAMHEGKWVDAQGMFAGLIQERPDYQRDGQLAASLLKDAITRRKGRPTRAFPWQRRREGAGGGLPPPPGSIPAAGGAGPVRAASKAKLWLRLGLFILGIFAALNVLVIASISTIEYFHKPVSAGQPVYSRPLTLEEITLDNASQLSDLGEVGWIGVSGSPRAIAISQDGTLLAVSGDSYLGYYRHFSAAVDTETGAIKQVYYRHPDTVLDMALSPDASLLAVGLDNGSIQIWDVASGRLLHTLNGHTGSVLGLAFSPDGSQLASASRDLTVRTWNASDGGLLRVLEAHTSWVTSLAFSPDGDLFASATDNSSIRLWGTSNESLDRAWDGRSAIYSLAFSPDGSLLATGSGDQTIRLWQVSDGSLLRTLEGHKGTVISVAFSPDGSLLASGSDDSTVRLWGVSDGELLNSFSVGGTPYDVLFTRDSRLILATSGGFIRALGIGEPTTTSELAPTSVPEVTITQASPTEVGGGLPDLGGRTVTVAVEGAYPPFNAIDESSGSGVGWDYDTVGEICARLNCVPEFRQVDWDSALGRIQAGEFDMLANGVGITEERQQVVDFSMPYASMNDGLLVVRADEARSLSELQADPDARIGAATGTYYETIAKEKFPAERVISYEGSHASVEGVLNGEVVGAVHYTVEALEFMRANEGQLKIAAQLEGEWQLGFAFPPGSELRPAVDAALQSMIDDGALETLNVKWGLSLPATQALLVQAKSWPVRIVDTYGEDSGNWLLGPFEDEFVSIDGSLQDGKYRLHALAKTEIVRREQVPMDDAADFFLEVTASQLDHPDIGSYGLFFRRADGDYYLYEVNERGQYRFSIWISGSWETLIDWWPISAIHPGQPNRLGVVADGDTFSFYINDQFVARYSDDRLASGAVGLAISLAENGQEATWEFDDFRLLEKPP